jgi:hypothetical protein
MHCPKNLPVDPVTNFGIVPKKLMGEFLGQLKIKLIQQTQNMFGDFSVSAGTYHVFDRPPDQNWFLRPTVGVT